MNEDFKMGLNIFAFIAGVLLLVSAVAFGTVKLSEYSDNRFIEVCENAGGIAVPVNGDLICERE